MIRPHLKSTVPTLNLLDPLINAFLNPEKDRLKDVLRDLLRRDEALGGSGYGFIYGSKIWHLRPMKDVKTRTTKDLHDELLPEMEGYELRVKNLVRDEQRMRQAFAVVLARCGSSQDVRDALPEPLVMLVQDLAVLPRTRPEGFLLHEFPLLEGQFKKAVDISLYYAARELLA